MAAGEDRGRARAVEGLGRDVAAPAGRGRHHMPEARAVGVQALVAQPLGADAEVGVLDAELVDRVPKAGALEDLALDQHRAAVDVVDLDVAVVLAAVRFALPALASDRLAV